MEAQHADCGFEKANVQDLNDEELRDAFVRERSDVLMAELMRRHGSQLLGMLTAYFRNSHDAEDTLQETWLCVWKYAGRQDSYRGDFMGWMKSIAFNKARNISRVKRWKRAVSENTLSDDGILDQLPDPKAVEAFVPAETQDTAQRLTGFLAELKQWYRETVIPYYFEDLSQGEIAALLGIPEATVKTRMSTARRLLRDMLETSNPKIVA